jgi:hypothetical protein
MSKNFTHKASKIIAAVLAAATLSCAAMVPQMQVADALPTGQSALVFDSAATDAVVADIAEQVSDMADVEIPAVETKLRRLRGDDVTSKMGRKASAILKSTYDLPMGSEVPFEMGGNQYAAKIELHYHIPEVHPLPWGWHRGISLFAVVPVG